MKANLSDRVKTLSAYAEEQGIAWQDQAKELPEGDQVARLGLLAGLLGIPLAAAMDEEVTLKDIDKLQNK